MGAKLSSENAVSIAASKPNNAEIPALSPPNEEITMTLKYALCGLALAAFATPALAADAFYVVQDSATLKCSIVEQKPTVDTMKLVGTTVYKTEAEADIAMKADKGCASN